MRGGSWKPEGGRKDRKARHRTGLEFGAAYLCVAQFLASFSESVCLSSCLSACLSAWRGACLYLSCPAVSRSCSLIFFPSSSIVRSLKSIPIVGVQFMSAQQHSRVKRCAQHMPAAPKLHPSQRTSVVLPHQSIPLHITPKLAPPNANDGHEVVERRRYVLWHGLRKGSLERRTHAPKESSEKRSRSELFPTPVTAQRARASGTSDIKPETRWLCNQDSRINAVLMSLHQLRLMH